jgi:hypothetical protein
VAMVRELEKELGPGRGAIARVASRWGPDDREGRPLHKLGAIQGAPALAAPQRQVRRACACPASPSHPCGSHTTSEHDRPTYLPGVVSKLVTRPLMGFLGRFMLLGGIR